MVDTPQLDPEDAQGAKVLFFPNGSEPKELLQLQVDEKTSQGEDHLRLPAQNIDYPTGFRLVLLTTALCLCIFLVALVGGHGSTISAVIDLGLKDQTIISTAIPKIVDDFKALDDVGWYGSAYLLTTASFQLTFGKLYTFYIKHTFLGAIAIFELGSLLCGVAPNSTTLIIGRAVAGIGCAGIFSGALIIIANSVPIQKRPVYSSLVGAMWGLSSVIGPLLGGLFADKVSWRWCFYINLPIGGISFAFIVLFFKPPRREHAGIGIGVVNLPRLKEFDPLGCILVIPAICCLLLALQWGNSKFPWSDGRVIALLVLFSVLSLAFVIVQNRMKESATVPPRIIKQRSIWAGVVYSACMMACFFVLLYFLPIWFQAAKGDSAVKSGIRILPLIIGVVVASIISGAWVSYSGYYTPFMVSSTVFTAIGTGLLTTLHVDSSPGAWIGYQFIAGFGIGLGIQQPSMAVQTVLDMSDVSVGIAVIVFSQMLGSSIFVSVAQNIFITDLTAGLQRSLPGLDPKSILNMGPTNLKEGVPIEYLPLLLDVYSSAITKSIVVAVGTASASGLGSGMMEWRRMARN